MPSSFISFSDLVDVTRTPSAPLENATETGTNFNINLVGSSSNTSGWNIFCGLPGNFILEGEIDWNGLVLGIPSDAKIKSLRIGARVDYVASAAYLFNRLTGTMTKTATVRTGVAVGLATPDGTIIPSENININDSSIQQELIMSSSINLVTGISNGSALISREYDFTTEPGGNIDLATLVTQFTRQRIVLSSSHAISETQSSSGFGDAEYSNDASISTIVTSWDATVIWEYIWQFTTNPIDHSVVEPGQTVTITSNPENPDALLLDELSIEYNGVPMIPTTQGPNIFIFTIPWDFPFTGSLALNAIGNGTQFSGSIQLGILEILLVNASGIYVLQPGQAYDTLYASTRDGLTRIVKIPDPFIKTGFIGG